MMLPFHTPNIEITEELTEQIKSILGSGWVSISSYVKTLENLFEERFNVKYAIACSSATTGLVIAIKALRGKNRNIVMPAFTWPSTSYAAECNCNGIIFCDIDPDSWLISEEDLNKKVRSHLNIHVIIAVDTFGNECRTLDYGVPVIYDAAHGWDLPNLGQRGLVEVVSLSHTKLVTATEGGMILTNNKTIADTARELRRLSGRMEEINASIALISIFQYAQNKEIRDKIIEKYDTQLKIPFKKQLIPNSTNNSVYSILVDPQLRDKIKKNLTKKRIEYKIYYDPLVDYLSNTSYIYSRIISLPVYPKMWDKQDLIIDTINRSFE